MNTGKSQINDLSTNTPNAMTHEQHWLDIRKCYNQGDLSSQYANICQQHHLSNKWILMINPQADCLQQLSTTHGINTRNILQVHTQSTKNAQKNIASALAKGHCSAVILCNPCLQQEDICQLHQSAQQGQTACIVLSEQTFDDQQKLH